MIRGLTRFWNKREVRHGTKKTVNWLKCSNDSGTVYPYLCPAHQGALEGRGRGMLFGPV